MSALRWRAIVTVVVIGSTVAAACGVSGEGELQRIGSDDLAGLDQTTTTSSTTTTTIPPSTTTINPTDEATTTTIATEPVQLYFLDGSRLVDISINLAGDPSASRVIAALEAGPPTDEVGIGLQTLLPPRLITSVAESGAGFATVDLASGPFEDGIQPRDQRLAIAQIVLTLTRRPGIGQVQFTLDGEPLTVPGRDNVQTEPGALVSRDDYRSLLLEPSAETETTPEPAPPTAAPPSTEPQPTS